MLVILVYCFLGIIAMSFSFGDCVSTTGHNYLLNRHLKVAAVKYSPFIIFYCNEKEIPTIDECPDKASLKYGGVLWELLNLVKIKRNVTFSILSPPDQAWGFCYGVSNCTGMIGMVNQGEVDFALGMFRNYPDGIYLKKVNLI